MPQMEHSTILLTFIKLSFVIKIFILSIFEWPSYSGFTLIIIMDKEKYTPCGSRAPPQNAASDQGLHCLLTE